MRRTGLGVTGLLVATTLAVAACTGGGGDTATGPDSGGKGGGGTITWLMGQPDDPAVVGKVRADIAKFEAANQGAKVVLRMLPNDTLRTVLQTQLRSSSGPDVFSYDTGPGYAGVLARAGLLYDLTDAYQRYGWKTYDWAKQRVTFGGKVLGMPDQVEEIGIFYNKDLFQRYGISQPTNLTELEQAAQKLKDNGVIPMTYSDKEGWEGGHMLSAPLSSLVGADELKALLDGRKPWNSPEVVKAIDLFFVKFREKGFLPKSPDALTYDNANALFYSGKAAMNPTGTWLVHDIEATVKFAVGFMPFPAPDGAGIPAGGIGNGTFVSARSKNPELAVKFIDHLQGQEHGRFQVENYSTIPAFPIDTDGVKASPLFEQILDDTGKIASGKGEFGYNIDVLMPAEFNKTMSDGLQSVLNGKKTAQQLADEMQAAFEKSRSS